MYKSEPTIISRLMIIHEIDDENFFVVAPICVFELFESNDNIFSAFSIGYPELCSDKTQCLRTFVGIADQE